MATAFPIVELAQGRPVVLSTRVADNFEKPHRSLLRDVKTLLTDAPECAHNFVLTSVDLPMPKGGFRKSPAYNMTRDGFTLLAMGFTGKKALQWKIRYIQAFNAMEQRLLLGRQKESFSPLPYGKPLVTGATVRELDELMNEVARLDDEMRTRLYALYERMRKVTGPLYQQVAISASRNRVLTDGAIEGLHAHMRNGMEMVENGFSVLSTGTRQAWTFARMMRAE